MWTTNLYKSFYKNILLFMSSRLSKIRSVHIYYICYAPDGLFWLNPLHQKSVFLQGPREVAGQILSVYRTENGAQHFSPIYVQTTSCCQSYLSQLHLCLARAIFLKTRNAYLKNQDFETLEYSRYISNEMMYEKILLRVVSLVSQLGFHQRFLKISDSEMQLHPNFFEFSCGARHFQFNHVQRLRQ